MKMPEVITSRTNPTVKWLASLTEKKYRDREAVFLADGEKLWREALRAGAPLTHIVLREDRGDLVGEALAYVGSHPACTLCRLSESCFDKITAEKGAQGVIVVAKRLDNFGNYNIIYKDASAHAAMRGLLLLDGVRDPGNVGAILRSAAAFGVTDVILSRDCADLWHPRTLRASMGAVFHLRLWATEDLPGTVRDLRASGKRIWAACLGEGAVSVREQCPAPEDGVVIGNEGHGITPAVTAACDGCLYLPISDAVESLNASVAASLFAWEMMRPL